jgi:hypothetical protein
LVLPLWIWRHKSWFLVGGWGLWLPKPEVHMMGQ